MARNMDLTAAQIAEALNMNPHTTAEPVGTFISITVRPQNSSRAFIARVEVVDVTEI